MRPTLFIALAFSLALTRPAAAQDDWSLTRRRPARAGQTRPGRHRRATGRRPAQPPVDRRALLIGRYTELLLADPFQEASFQRLASLYRERDGDIQALRDALQDRIEKQGESYELRVLLGHALLAEGRTADARAAYERAAEMRAAAALALGRIAEPRATKALKRAAADPHPAVRAALHEIAGVGGPAAATAD